MKVLAGLPALRCVLCLMMGSTWCAAQSSYSITDLGVINTNGYSTASAVNLTGEVTGAAGAANSASSEIFSYSNGKMTSLGTLGGTSGIGNAINASGTIAGYSQNSKNVYRAFMTSGTKLVDIGDLGGGSAVAYGINDVGTGCRIGRYGGFKQSSLPVQQRLDDRSGHAGIAEGF